MEALIAMKDLHPIAYTDRFDGYKTLLVRLIDGLDYYVSSLRLTSYTGTNDWQTVYGVHRSATKGTARVEGKENVYDDQMWIIRELIRAYRLTKDTCYLKKAEQKTH